MKKNVFVVDDHAAIREGFKAILDRSGEWMVGGEAGSAEELLARLETGEALPDLFLVDVSLPGMNGIDLIANLRKRARVPAIVLSMHRRYDYIAQALRAGAAGYVAKDSGVECIVQALSAAWQGGCYLDPVSLRLFVDEVVSGRAAASSPRHETDFPSSGDSAREEIAARVGAAGLSEREDEVLGLLAAGRRAEEIAALLGLSQKTVENHLSNITAKLGIHNRFELYRLAARLSPG